MLKLTLAALSFAVIVAFTALYAVGADIEPDGIDTAPRAVQAQAEGACFFTLL